MLDTATTVLLGDRSCKIMILYRLPFDGERLRRLIIYNFRANTSVPVPDLTCLLVFDLQPLESVVLAAFCAKFAVDA